MTPTEQAAENTDRELWRERPGDFYSDSIHVTKNGGIGMNVGGSVIVMPIRNWFAALTAAAEVGTMAQKPWPEGPKLYPHPMDRDAPAQRERNEIIERCAQVADTATITVGDATETRANIAAAIRALKND